MCGCTDVARSQVTRPHFTALGNNLYLPLIKGTQYVGSSDKGFEKATVQKAQSG